VRFVVGDHAVGPELGGCDGGEVARQDLCLLELRDVDVQRAGHEIREHRGSLADEVDQTFMDD
jgi:hypothetical protein